MARKPNHEREAKHPESLMMSYGYRPEWSEWAVKPPLFQTSTFSFPNARTGKEFFAQAYGLSDLPRPRHAGLIYSRINNPDLEILEERLCLWDESEAAAGFVSGMAAIATSMLALVPSGTGIVFTRPVYGGTDYLLEHVLPSLGIRTREVPAGADEATVAAACEALAQLGHPCHMVFVETPANPTVVLTDIAGAARAAHAVGALCAVDNTLLGPLYQSPLAHGADLVLYSATKYLGGHSDIVAGAALGSRDLIDRIKFLRGLLGTTLGAHSAWLLLRSLETFKLRMTCARKNAEKVARWLADHPAVARVHFPSHATGTQRAIYERQCSGPGALLSFVLVDDREETAFAVLDAVRMIKLAVSLGGTESLIEHPATMTHADVPVAEQRAIGITPGMIRLSVGIEHPEDLIADLERALAAIPVPAEPKAEPVLAGH